jgi:hypothetical protein
MRCTDETLIPATFATAGAVQWVVTPGGIGLVSAITRSPTSGPRADAREAASFRASPSIPLARPLLPAPHAGLALAGAAHDLDRTKAGHGQEDDPRSLDNKSTGQPRGVRFGFRSAWDCRDSPISLMKLDLRARISIVLRVQEQACCLTIVRVPGFKVGWAMGNGSVVFVHGTGVRLKGFKRNLAGIKDRAAAAGIEASFVE